MDGRLRFKKTRREQKTLTLNVSKTVLKGIRTADVVNLTLSSRHKIDMHRLRLGNLSVSARDGDSAEVTVNGELTNKNPAYVRFTDGMNEVEFHVESFGSAFTARPMSEGLRAVN